MSHPDKIRTMILNRLRRFEEAVRIDEMAGGSDPDDIEPKRILYKQEKEKLVQWILSYIDI